MHKQLFITARTVANELNVSTSKSYQLIRQWNEELKSQGYIVIAGKIPRQYFYERLYGTYSKEGKDIASI